MSTRSHRRYHVRIGPFRRGMRWHTGDPWLSYHLRRTAIPDTAPRRAEERKNNPLETVVLSSKHACYPSVWNRFLIHDDICSSLLVDMQIIHVAYWCCLPVCRVLHFCLGRCSLGSSRRDEYFQQVVARRLKVLLCPWPDYEQILVTSKMETHSETKLSVAAE